MPNINPYEQYKTASIETLTPGELVILLYDEAILSLKKAIVNLKNQKINDTHNNIIKAENIIIYLMEILDTNYPITKQLMSTYQTVYDLLIQANIKKDEVLLNQISDMLTELKNTWQKAEIVLHKKNSKQTAKGKNV